MLLLQEADPKRVVIAARKANENRRLGNTQELASSLRSKGFNVSVATFGDMTFEEQLLMVADAKVLVGVHGSDLVNMLFMPLRAVVIEVLPLVLGVPLFNPELANQARNYGKFHRPYYSPFNATLFQNPETGEPIDARPIHQAKMIEVHVPDVVSLIQGSVSASDALMFYGFSLTLDQHGLISSCGYNHPAPQGILYGCDRC